MGEATLDRPPPRAWRPWSQAWIEAAPVAPVWVGLGLAALHLLAGAGFYMVAADRLGSVGGPPRPLWWVDPEALGSTAVFSLLIGYGPAALAYARRHHRATFEALRPVLRAAPGELAGARAELERFDVGWLRLFGAVAAASAVLVTLFTTGIPEELGWGNPWLFWILWQNGLAFWLNTRTVAHDFRVSRLLSRWTERWAEVDPLDRAPLAPLARRGLQSALLIVLGISIFVFVNSIGSPSSILPYTQAGMVAVAAAALVLPSLGVHKRLGKARREALARLSAEIRAARDDPQALERRAALLTLRQHTEAAREWPFDLGTLGRFALYAGIGLGSWVGGALVERLLDLAIG